MPDYAASPIQPIVEGLVTFPGGPPNIEFDGKGISSILYIGMGHYILFFDEGLPGNSGAVPALPEFPLVLPIDPDVRTNIMPLGVGVPPVSGIQAIGIAYIASLVQGVGATAIDIVLTNAAFVGQDPQNGFEIIVWRGLGGGPVPPP